jgi:hypothetical protein
VEQSGEGALCISGGPVRPKLLVIEYQEDECLWCDGAGLCFSWLWPRLPCIRARVR